MKIYNTLSTTIQDVKPLVPSHLGLYACGPTVYDYAHLGHARKYTMDDVLVRTLRHANFVVKHVMNITDVGHLVSDDDAGEDKMEKGARKYNKTVWEVAQEFEAFFWKMTDAMNIKRPDISCRATDHIEEQIELIKTLDSKGYTYTIADGVYFDTSKFPTYNQLSKFDPEKIKAGSRVEMVPGKKHATDFALWKFSPSADSGPVKQKRQMEWESPWSPPGRDKSMGFPGWHIECSAMSMKYLGDQFEIHTGGIDHISIHHPNEIAQSEAATGKSPFVQIWVHHNFLRIEGEKMSKSLGNFLTLDDLINKGYSPMALRLFFLSAHYRSELNFTFDQLDVSQKSYQRLLGLLSSFRTQTERSTLSPEKMDKVNDFRHRFFDQMENDLRTPEAMSIFWEVVKSNIPGTDKYDLLLEFDSVLGLDLGNQVETYDRQKSQISIEAQSLIDKRETARKAGDFALADSLRLQILALGFVVEDTKEGQIIKKGSK